MENQFVTYEIALKLKELGFDEKCVASYYTYDIKNFSKGKYDYRGKFEFDYSTEDQYIVNSNETYYVSAPLWQQVIDWFDKKDIHIMVQFPQSISGCVGMISTIEKSMILVDKPGTIWTNRNEFYKAAILKAIELCQKKK